MGIRSQGTLSAGIHLDDPGPPGRVCPTPLPPVPGDWGLTLQPPSPYLSGPGVDPQLLGQRQKGRQLLTVQEQVDGHPAACGSFYQVQKQVWVGEDIHDHGHQLRGGERGCGWSLGLGGTFRG